MTFRLFTGHGKSKPEERATPDKRTGTERPVRLYSLLLPPTLPRDRR